MDPQPYVYIYIYPCAYADTYVCKQVPDGEYILYLYQTESIADLVDETAIADVFRIENISLIPERDDSITDFFYGTYMCMYAWTMYVCQIPMR
jgi:hypothetical protein